MFINLFFFGRKWHCKYCCSSERCMRIGSWTKNSNTFQWPLALLYCHIFNHHHIYTPIHKRVLIIYIQCIACMWLDRYIFTSSFIYLLILLSLILSIYTLGGRAFWDLRRRFLTPWCNGAWHSYALIFETYRARLTAKPPSYT